MTRLCQGAPDGVHDGVLSVAAFFHLPPLRRAPDTAAHWQETCRPTRERYALPPPMPASSLAQRVARSGLSENSLSSSTPPMRIQQEWSEASDYLAPRGMTSQVCNLFHSRLAFQKSFQYQLSRDSEDIRQNAAHLDIGFFQDFLDTVSFTGGNAEYLFPPSRQIAQFTHDREGIKLARTRPCRRRWASHRQSFQSVLRPLRPFTSCPLARITVTNVSSILNTGFQ